MPVKTKSKHILIVDDEPAQHQLIGDFLRQKGFAVEATSDAREALQKIESARPDLVIMDVRMPGMDGFTALQAIREMEPTLPVLLITAYTDVRDAVRAMKDGAVDYLAKPVDFNELLAAINDAIGPVETVSAPTVPPLPEGYVFASGSMRGVLEQLALVAPSDASVIFTGESGTGKEVLTDILHDWSARREGPIVKVNCAAVPENLLEGELFGYEAGAFTGATKAKAGRLELAHGGTLFLDEIGDMPPALQAKLLRVLDDRIVQRLGSNKPIQVDFRLVAATNRDIERMIDEGQFREDLYYRISVMSIHVPPLRERRADITLLATEFARRFAGERVRFSPAAIHALERYNWPGNVRELRNEIERACLLCRGNVILPEHLSPRVARSAPSLAKASSEQDAGTTLAEIEKATILRTLEECGGNRTQAAKKLGISRRTLIYKLKSYESE